MDIEKALRNYLNNKGPKVKVNDFCSILNNNDSNAIINVIFKLVNYEIDTMDDSKCLDRVVEVLKFIEVIVFLTSQLFKTKYKGLYTMLQKVKIKTIVSIIIIK